MSPLYRLVGHVDEDGILFYRLPFYLHQDRAGRVFANFYQGGLRHFNVSLFKFPRPSEFCPSVPFRQIVTGGALLVARSGKLAAVNYCLIVRLVRAIRQALRGGTAAHRKSVLISFRDGINARLVLLRGRNHAVQLNCLIRLLVSVE